MYICISNYIILHDEYWSISSCFLLKGVFSFNIWRPKIKVNDFPNVYDNISYSSNDYNQNWFRWNGYKVNSLVVNLTIMKAFHMKIQV